MFDGTLTAARRICAIRPYRSSAGKPAEYAYTRAASSIASRHTSRRWCGRSFESPITNHQSRRDRRLADHEQRLVELDRLAAFAQDCDHGAGNVGLDRVEHLHRLDDAQGLAGLDLLADGDEGRLVRGRGGVEGADHRRADHEIRRAAGR